ncbi:MAG: M15 family metallopeptidase, partial [Pseudomonadota bacterium]
VNKNRDRRSDMNRPVSADFPLPPSYTPENLVFANVKGIEVSKSPDIEEMMIRSLTVSGEGNDVTMASLLRELLQSCQTNKERLSLRSGYRSYATQKALYDRLGHRGKIAKAGTSEHQLGLAVDIDVNGRFMRSTDRSYKCFKEQAWQYGFILTYPRGNTYLEAEDSFEPWHWRFVGPQTALLYREIGPVGYPQEFLAALPCYEERALSGLYISAEEHDICIENMITPRQTAPLKGDPSPATAQMVETSF